MLLCIITLDFEKRERERQRDVEKEREIEIENWKYFIENKREKER